MAGNLHLQNLISLLQSILLIFALSTAAVVTALLQAKPESTVNLETILLLHFNLTYVIEYPQKANLSQAFRQPLHFLKIFLEK